MKYWIITRYGNQSYRVQAHTILEALFIVNKQYNLDLSKIWKVKQEPYHPIYDEDDIDLPTRPEVSI